MADERIITEMEVSTKELAQVLGLSVRRVQQMIQDGTIDTIQTGVLNLSDSVQRYIKFLSKSMPDEEDTKLERTKKMAEAQLKASKATVAKLEAEELKGNMHRSEDVAAFTEDLIFEIRSALIALPGRLAVDVSAVDTPAEASEVIRKEVHKVMRELAAYKYAPEKYQERVRERMEWSDGADEDD